MMNVDRNNRAVQLHTDIGHTDFLAHTCQYLGRPSKGILVGEYDPSNYNVMVIDGTGISSRPMLSITVTPASGPMSFHDQLTPAEARLLATALMHAANYHEAMQAIAQATAVQP